MASVADAGPTRVGNGDDGSDLESGKKVTSGILIETRADAIARIAKLNAQNVPGLGRLLVEIEKSEIFYVAHDVKPTAESGSDGIERNSTVVFARTFPEPVAPTRFFAAALTLEREQLIALHIHEALHRALPPDLRENETAVSQLTLSLSAPDSTHDRVQATMAKVLYANRFESTAASNTTRAQNGATGVSSTDGLPVSAAAPAQSFSIREYLGLGGWKVKYAKTTIDTQIANHDDGAPTSLQVKARIGLDSFGPFGKTSFEPFIAMGTYTTDVTNAPAGARLSTQLWSDDVGEFLVSYRYVTATPASDDFRGFAYSGRTIKEYSLQYQETIPQTVRWRYSLGIIEGGAIDHSAELYSRFYPGKLVAIDFGSMITVKVNPSIQLTGDLASGRGLFLYPSLELVEIEPITTTRVKLDWNTNVGFWTDIDRGTQSLVPIAGLGIGWQGEKARFGAEFKHSAAIYGSIRLSQTGDYYEHGADTTHASLSFGYSL